VTEQSPWLLAVIIGNRLFAKREESVSGVKRNSPDRQAKAYSV
jgi:hypothetical protein